MDNDQIVGEFTAGLLLEVIVELKLAAALSDLHLSQYRNDWRAMGNAC